MRYCTVSKCSTFQFKSTLRVMDEDTIDIVISTFVTVLRSINAANQTFECVLVLHTKWYEKIENVVSSWEPEMFFTNIVGETKIMFKNTDRIIRNNMIEAINTLIVSGEFAEHFELRQFPIDYQHLQIHVNIINCPAVRRHSLDRPSTTQDWFEKRFRLKQKCTQMIGKSFLEKSTWRIVEPVTLIITKTNPVYDPHGTSYCKFIIQFTVSRKPSHYFWYFIFPVSTQVTIGFITVMMANSNIGDKASITLTNILTMFAIKFACMQYLPAVACLTYLDKYFVYSACVLLLLLTQNVTIYLMQKSYDEKTVNVVNYISAGVMLSLWFFSQVIVYVVMLFDNARKLLLTPEVDGEKFTKEHVIIDCSAGQVLCSSLDRSL